MTGFYHYDIKEKRWQWHINYMNVQVASGTCNNKKEMDEVIEKHGNTNWIKAH